MKIYLMKDGDWILFENPTSDDFKSRNITIGEGSKIGEWSTIGARSTIGEGSKIGARSTIGEGSTIGASSTIGEWSKIGARSTIGEGSKIGEGSTIGARSTIGEGSKIGEGSTIGEGSKIETSFDCIVLGPIGSREAMMTAYIKDKVIQIGTGCFIGPIDKFEKKVKEVHAGNKFEKQYLDALEYVRKKFNYGGEG